MSFMNFCCIWCAYFSTIPLFGLITPPLAPTPTPTPQVMLMTLQEPPPSVDTYDDQSFKFCTSFRDLVKTCLQKDPAKRYAALSVSILHYQCVSASVRECR